MDNLRQHSKFCKTLEVYSYKVPFKKLPRPIFWFNDRFEAGTWSGQHCHESWGELAFIRSGHLVICTDAESFLVSPQRAVWIPPGQSHEWYVPQSSEDNALFIAPNMLPLEERFGRLHVLEIRPLIRELIIALVANQQEYREGPVSRMVAVLLDQLAAAEEIREPFVMPRDHRLVELSTQLLNAPDITNTIRDWCKQIGMSERTLARLFKQQTGSSFAQWRQEMRLHHALSLLQKGESVTNVALSCGYYSISSFISLFRKRFSQTPGRYVSELDKK